MSNITPDTTLVIAPDSSSNEYDIHQELRERGIDVLVLDHHQADQVSQYACVVNNQLCDYPNKSLSGVGVVYKLCQYIDSILGLSISENFLDLVATGLIGDMMDLRSNETRYLVNVGLTQPFKNHYLRAMVEKNGYQLGEEVTPIGVAFYIVPYVNAIARAGTMDEKLVLFESMLDFKALDEVPSTKRGCKGEIELRVDQAVRTCTNVKNRQTKSRDIQAEKIETIIQAQGLLDNKILIIKLEDKNINRSILGLIANELMSKYQRPVVLLAQTEHEGKMAWEGSARGYEKSQLKDFKQLARDSQLVYLAEGHPNAFGFGIYDDNYQEFIDWTNEILKDVEFSPSYQVDFAFDSDAIDAVTTILQLGQYKHLWGQNVEEPLLVVENVRVTKDMLTLMARDRNPTLKITLPNGIDCIKFKSSEEELESLYSESGCVTVNLVGRAAVNKYYNRTTPQIIITDYEIISKQDYYF